MFQELRSTDNTGQFKQLIWWWNSEKMSDHTNECHRKYRWHYSFCWSFLFFNVCVVTWSIFDMILILLRVKTYVFILIIFQDHIIDNSLLEDSVLLEISKMHSTKLFSYRIVFYNIQVEYPISINEKYTMISKHGFTKKLF